MDKQYIFEEGNRRIECSKGAAEIIECFPYGIAFYHYKTKELTLNKAMRKMLNLGRHDGLGELTDMLHTCLSGLILRREDRRVSNEEVVLTIGGENRSFLVSTKAVVNRQNEPFGEVVVFQNSDEIMTLQNTLLSSHANSDLDRIIARNEAMVEAKAMVKRVAKYSSSVLISGEWGTEKSLFAQAIHGESVRKDQPFVMVHCGVLSETQLEGELFGYEPSVFAGPQSGGKMGKLELAANGTLYLNEVECLSLDIQGKLAQALSSNSVSRLGGTGKRPLNVRVISSTRKDLLEEMEAGDFSKALYYRLNMSQIDLPPLRKRTEDIPLLVEAFVSHYADKFDRKGIQVSEGFLEVLSYYCWPGNVRELMRAIERAVLHTGIGKPLEEKHLPKKIRCAYEYKSLKNKVYGHGHAVGKEGGNLLKTGEELIIEMVLKEEKGNLKKAASRLGISRPTLYKKINESHKLTKYKESLQEGNEDSPAMD